MCMCVYGWRTEYYRALHLENYSAFSISRRDDDDDWRSVMSPPGGSYPAAQADILYAHAALIFLIILSSTFIRIHQSASECIGMHQNAAEFMDIKVENKPRFKLSLRRSGLAQKGQANMAEKPPTPQ